MQLSLRWSQLASHLELTLDGCFSLSCPIIHRRNWPEKDNTWEPYGHVARCRDILEEFEARYIFYCLEHCVVYLVK